MTDRLPGFAVKQRFLLGYHEYEGREDIRLTDMHLGQSGSARLLIGSSRFIHLY